MRAEKSVIVNAIGKTHTAARAIRKSIAKRQIAISVVEMREPANAGT